MQPSEFLHFLGYSSGSTGSWDVFRGRWHHTAISGILLLRGVLSRAGWGCFLRFLLLLRFPYLPGRPSRMSLFDAANFEIFIEIFKHRLPDVTFSSGRSLSSSTSESRHSHLSCHHPGVLFQQYVISGTRRKVAAQKEVTAQNHVTAQNMSFCQPSKLPWIPHQQCVLALEKS